jgi:hypothetical protein
MRKLCMIRSNVTLDEAGRSLRGWPCHSKSWSSRKCNSVHECRIDIVIAPLLPRLPSSHRTFRALCAVEHLVQKAFPKMPRRGS